MRCSQRPERQSLITALFEPALAAALLQTDAAGRADLLKQRMRQRFAELPARCRAGAQQQASADELHVAREFDYSTGSPNVARMQPRVRG